MMARNKKKVNEGEDHQLQVYPSARKHFAVESAISISSNVSTGLRPNGSNI